MIRFSSPHVTRLPWPVLASRTRPWPVQDEIGTIIESFVTKQFPDAASHFWVVNETQWDGDEMIVDVARNCHGATAG